MQHLHFYKWGGGRHKAIPILALHGFTGSGLDFECFVENTADQFTWWVPDLMGHGDSPVTENVDDYTVSAHIEYLDKIAKDIGSRFMLLGYSMGGRLALRYALQRPELISHLILVGATPGIENPEERKLRQQSDEALADTIMKEGVKRFLKTWNEQPIIKTQENIPDFLRTSMMKRRHQNNPLGLANTLRAMGTGTMEPLWGRLNEIKCPVTLITGEMDNKFCEIIKQMQKQVPAISHKIIPKAGHAAIWEDMNSFINLISSSNRAL